MKVYSPWCCPSGNFVFTFVLGAREAGVSKDGHGRDRSGGILRDAVLRTAPQSLTHNNAREIGGSDALACGGKGFQPAQSPRLIESSQASTAGRLAGALRFKPLKRLVFIFGQALRMRSLDRQVGRSMFHVKHYLPIQKSRKITSRTCSTSTRPINRPNARAARRSSSAMMSSRPDAPSAQARRSASAQSANAVRCLSRVTSADSAPPEKNRLAYSASPPTRSSNDAPVSAEIR